MTLTDVRCPMCDRLLFGRQEIVADKSSKPVNSCRHCQVSVALTFDSAEPERFYYDVESKKGA
jgi:hypothetical protein